MSIALAEPKPKSVGLASKPAQAIAPEVVDDGHIMVPVWVRDLESFRQWARSDEFPEEGRICWFGQIWIDMSKEQLFSHNQIKAEVTFTVKEFQHETQSGTYFTDGARISNVDADLSAVPDGLFIKHETFQSGQIVMRDAASGAGPVELEGTPDVAIEIISPSSVGKDTKILTEKYWLAGIPEYWLIDAQGEQLSFKLHMHTYAGYELATPDADGWVRSDVLGSEFRLTETTNAIGHRDFRLETRVENAA